MTEYLKRNRNMYNDTEIYKMKHMYTFGKKYNLILEQIKRDFPNI